MAPTPEVQQLLDRLDAVERQAEAIRTASRDGRAGEARREYEALLVEMNALNRQMAVSAGPAALRGILRRLFGRR